MPVNPLNEEYPCAVLYYVHDPMCSWCWGFKACWERLQKDLKTHFGDTLSIVPVVGGLARDTDEPMPDQQRATIAATWKNIEQQLGAEFNHDFWSLNTPRRSTYMSCRAVLAAQAQSRGGAMLEAIQKAYYLRALNPSDTELLVQLAAELGLDVEVFRRALDSRALEVELHDAFRLTRSLPIQGFPSLVLCRSKEALDSAGVVSAIKDARVQVDYINLDYVKPAPMLAEIESLLT